MEIEKVLITNNVKKILSSTNEPSGFLAGWSDGTQTFSVAVAGCVDYFISGLKVNGIFCIVNNIPTTGEEYLGLCEQHHRNLKVELEDAIVLFVCQSNKKDDDLLLTAKFYSSYYNTTRDLNIETIVNIPAVLLRASGQIPCVFEVVSDADMMKENVEQALERIRTLFQKEVAAFLLKNSKIVQHKLMDQENNDSYQTVKQLLKSAQDDDSSEKTKAKKNMKKKIPTNFDILIQASGDVALESSFNHSVVIHCQQRISIKLKNIVGGFQCASVHIPVDVLVACQESDTTRTVYKLFLNAIEQQLIEISQCLIKHTKVDEIDTPTPYHFYPDIWDFPITIVYPRKKSDKELESYRQELHKKLLLPMDRPFVKKLNSYNFSTTSSSGHLYNPHEGISSSGIQGGKVALVQGTYSYHHYMQDHMNDNGWGCAYRSLQTIISWFRLQGYTEKNVPTHEEIQRALVAVGDKTEKFIGSKQWIGSQEVSFCLDHLINVQSKIMFVSSGAEMANKGRELCNHFLEQGTPVMIGGGVLAHTILGVDFNQDSGDLKFLILDPHYTGKEDLNIILSKGWCGWKDVKFWDQTAFYNLCLPQRPKQI